MNDFGIEFIITYRYLTSQKTILFVKKNKINIRRIIQLPSTELTHSDNNRSLYLTCLI